MMIRHSVVSGLLVMGLMACGHPPMPPLPPTPPQMHRENFTVADAPGAVLRGAQAVVVVTREAVESPQDRYTAVSDEGGRVSILVPDTVASLEGQLTVTLAGYRVYTDTWDFCPWDCEQPPVMLVRDLPVPPTRDQALTIKTSDMQGLTVVTEQFGELPWWGAALSSLSPSDRQRVYAAKRAAGDTHCIIALSWNYAQPGQPYGSGNLVPPRDLTQDLPAFRALVEEVIRAGFVSMVFLAGDGNSLPGGGYNDPVGWTYGYEWLYANLPRVVEALRDLSPYIVWSPGFDGVFFGWEPSNLKVPAFGARLRQLLPNGYLAIEHDIGHIPIGNGPADYAPGGGMRDFDVILSEFNPWNLREDSLWQVAGRLLGPRFRRPADMPPGDDPAPPWYLAPGTPRGPYYTAAFEVDTYTWVRRQVSAAQVQANRRYLEGMGYR